MTTAVTGVEGVGGTTTVPSVDWITEDGPRQNSQKLGRALRAANANLYRKGERGRELVEILPDGGTRHICTPADLASMIIDTLDFRVMKHGQRWGDMPSGTQLNAALKSERFLAEFPPLNQVTKQPLYRENFTLVEPGYDSKERILFIGENPEPASGTNTIEMFLDAMPFATPADRTNAVGAALEVLLANRWPGAKPLVQITATRSHAGKTTTTDFIAGRRERARLIYQAVDWPMRSELQTKLRTNPQITVIEIDNVRTDSAGGGAVIRSAFLESLVTSPEIALAAPGGGHEFSGLNRFVVIVNSNEGFASPDLLNRSLPIHLAPTGNLYEKESPIGNPRYEFLPKHCDQIDSELYGMIARWVEQGRPLDDSVRHPMIQCAQIIGGILKANGFTDFLGNYSSTRVTSDPVRVALALLAAARPGEPLRPREWAQLAKAEGLTKTLIPAADRGSESGEERGIGVVLSRHVGETFEVLTDRERLKVRLEGGIRRWESEAPHKRYQFDVLERESIPSEDDGDAAPEVVHATADGERA